MSGALLVAGTHSDAGKSVIVAGICRWLAREGVRVAPFKAQNMALNSFVTREGAEIGRAQAAQAAAAMAEPEAAMNPILLKPSAERITQVVVRGKAWATASAASYGAMKRDLMPVVLESLEDLRRRFDAVVCEGAGSPAEINLRKNDLANMGLARAAGLPVLLVGDIDRGGLFASLYGTLALLSPEDQSLLAGFLVNKFRGDLAVLAPGLATMTSLTGRPFFGTLPWIPGLGLDGEDSLALDAPRPVESPLGRDVLTVAVARLGRISNFTDFDALSHEPGVSVRFTRSAQEILDADLAIIPGTKATVEDLRLLRSQGLDEAFAERDRRRLPILGICGGYQMLGGSIEDGVESSEARADGLGLLPVETTFEAEKVLDRPEGRALGFGDAGVSGYEIHHGRIKRSGGEALFGTDDIAEGCRIGATLGTSWHGVLESDDFRRAFLTWIAAETNLDWRPGNQSFATAREAQLEKLGDLIADNVDREAVMRLVDDGPPSGLPVVRLQATGFRHQEGTSSGVSSEETSRSARAGTTSLALSAAVDAIQENLMPETFQPSKLLFVTTADTEILAAARASERLPDGFPEVRCANPVTLEDPASFLDGELPAARVVLVRLLGGRRAWPEGLEELRRRCARLGIPLLAFGGEAEPDAELTALSLAPSGTVLEAFEYLRHGGVGNTENLLRFVADTVLMEGYGFEPASPLPEVGVYHPHVPEGSPVEELLARHDPARPTVGVIFYRAHWMSGNTAFVDDLADALEQAGTNALPVYCYSLRSGADGTVPALELLKDRVDCLVTTVLAGGGSNAADAHRSGSPEEWLEWEVPALEELHVPVLQGISTTSTREAWLASDAGLSPLDTAWQVAIPEFDGRIIGVPFSFKERLGDGSPVGAPLTLYKTDPERTARLAGLATRFAKLGRVANAEKRIAILLSNYPTKHSRVGNAVGLDTPASAIRLLGAMRQAGYAVNGAPDDGDDLIHSLIAAGGHDLEFLTGDQLGNAAGRLSAELYAGWFARLPEELRSEVEEHWGPPPGDLYVDSNDFVVAGLTFGNVFVGIQPPRGFGENPIAIYHDPDLPPTHHYLAAYWWMIESFGADAIVHLGKHGTLEWLPGKSLGLSPSCAPDAVLRDVPLFYPFVVNDPGEGTQAKRRAHATVVDHLIPPMTRADTYDDLAKLEQLLDEYYQVETLDPSKLPAIRVSIWETLRDAELHQDLGVEEQPEEFSDFLTHVDGYLCEIKDLPIRGGLHILGEAPEGEPLRHLIASILRLGAGEIPGLRRAIANAFDLDERFMVENGGARVESPPALAERFPGTVATASDLLDRLEEAQQALLLALEVDGWEAEDASKICREVLGFTDPGVVTSLRFAADEVVPRLVRTPEEMGNLLSGLGGGYVPAGPSGSPTRGLVNVLPTGRNFYSVDPKALPSQLSWEVGQGLADDLLRRYLEEEGRYPESVGIVVWGTAAMRTQGDDIAEILALLGVRPAWNEESRRVSGLEVIPPGELGRPRIDVTVRISGFFRDAFPNLISLLDDAFTTVATLDEPDDTNFVKKHAREEKSQGADERRSTTRIFGSKPGAYGAGLLPLMDARNWRTDEDLAEVYAVWGGYAYGRGLDGIEAREAMESNLRRTEVAVKNIDNREHDLFDSDDYFQYHGGMIAAVRALTGRDPKAYIGDSADPSRVKTRDLSEEARRVFRSRVANPKWIGAMQRHGYKGAFELSATVDYLFGYDATAGVVEDWMYDDVTRKYVLDEDVRDFMQQSNPWALRAISERLLEAAQRGLWSEPDAENFEALKQVYLENEGMLEEQA